MQEYFRPSISVWIAGRSPCPAATILSRSSTAAFIRAGYLQLRQVEEDLRQLVRRRQVVPRERVDVGGVGHFEDQPFSVSRAIMSFCTSVAPS